MSVDLFTVDQAAALWAGFDPARVSSVESMQPSEAIAAKQMLVAAIVTGEIRANASTNALSYIGDHSKSLVSRNDLEAFARKRALFPSFLFDTLAPFETAGRLFGNNDVPRVKAVRPEAPSPSSNRGGRPAEYDWDTFVLEIIRRANHPDGLPSTQADLVRDMLSWFGQTCGKEPAESAVKDRVSKIYRYANEANNRQG